MLLQKSSSTDLVLFPFALFAVAHCHVLPGIRSRSFNLTRFESLTQNSGANNPVKTGYVAFADSYAAGIGTYNPESHHPRAGAYLTTAERAGA